jgi:pyruvate dehydrogenase phosphatase
VAYVKGALQTTRSIGDFNLKSKMFNNALPPVYRIDKPYTPPYITAVPEIHVLPRDETQEYLILGTDGLFDELSNEEVVEIVDQWHEKHKDEEGGGGSLSQHLANLALGNAARDIGVSVLDLSRIPKGARRRNLHDDITVIVVRLNRSL